MICPNSNCKTDNPEGAKYCRHCGVELGKEKVMPTNVRLPKYDLIPTTLIDWEKPWLLVFRTSLFSVVFAISFLALCYSIASLFSYSVRVEKKDNYYIDEKTEYYCTVSDNLIGFHCYCNLVAYDTESDARRAIDKYINNIILFIIICGLFSLLSILIIVFGKRKFPPKNNHLSDLADYIQKYQLTSIPGRKPVLKFYVKDNLMGLLDVAHYCVFLPAQYDKLEWKKKNKYLNATIGNRTFIIDIYGREVR